MFRSSRRRSASCAATIRCREARSSSACDAVRETCQRLVGRRPVAVDELVRPTLNPLAYGLKGNSNQSCGEDRERQIELAARANERTNSHHDADIDDRDEHRQCAIYKRTVDHDVDLVKP